MKYWVTRLPSKKTDRKVQIATERKPHKARKADLNFL